MSMFKGNQPAPVSRAAENNSPDRLNRIVEGTHIQGDIKSDSNIRIDGKVIGNIQTSGRLVIGVSGHIEGEIQCQNADIEGMFQGRITVQEQLSLKSTARLTGDIVANKLAIEPGANFSGSCTMGGKTSTARVTAQAQAQPQPAKTEQPVEA
jgi:cytoskeletal protein CcmA (bactofilin family)